MSLAYDILASTIEGAAEMGSKRLLALRGCVLSVAVLALSAAPAVAASWVVTSSPNPGSAFNYLNGVSCVSFDACIAVGNDGGANAALAERWNGIEWTSEAVPSATAEFSVLTAVSCSSSNACTAVGESGSPQVPLAERWNGTEWTIQTIPAPTGAVSSYLGGVSCSSSTSCIAVGQLYLNIGEEGPNQFAEKWNGTDWTILTMPSLTAEWSDLKSVSCTAPTECTAVGNEGKLGATEGLAERWNGTAWSAQAVVNPAGTQEANLSGVSCTSSTACTAVGQYRNSSAYVTPLAESWNGTKWAIQAVPSPPEADVTTEAPMGGSYLYGVSCTSSTACTATGRYSRLFEEAPGVVREEILTLGEELSGTTWTVLNTPNPTGQEGDWLRGISCVSSTECVTVGVYANGPGGAPPAGTPVTLAEVDPSGEVIQKIYEAEKRHHEEEAAAKKASEEKEATARTAREEKEAAAEKKHGEEISALKTSEEKAAAEIKYHEEQATAKSTNEEIEPAKDKAGEVHSAATTAMNEEEITSIVASTPTRVSSVPPSSLVARAALEPSRTTAPLTNGHMLTKVLKQCKKRPKKKRIACETQLKRQYMTVKNAKK
jgi:hypothetical protein